jgi:hypothetical protein
MFFGDLFPPLSLAFLLNKSKYLFSFPDKHTLTFQGGSFVKEGCSSIYVFSFFSASFSNDFAASSNNIFLPFKLAYLLEVRIITETKTKTDKTDSVALANLLREILLPKDYIPTVETRTCTQ